MASELISFRLGETEIQTLKTLQQSGESRNLTAQRVLREKLGSSTEALAVDRQTLKQTIEAIVRERIVSVNNVSRELIERLEALEKSLA